MGSNVQKLEYNLFGDVIKNVVIAEVSVSKELSG